MAVVRYRAELDLCRDRLRAVAADSGGAHLEAMVGNAKLLRATLVLAAGSSHGAPSTALVPAAVSIELLHLASLVHDDIIDEATERRGVPALHVAAGRDRALVIGDSLIAAAFEAIGEARVERFARCVAVLSGGAQACCSGQLEELDRNRHLLSEQRYLEVVAKKTGALFSAAAALGALVGGAGDDDVEALAALGTTFGVAYQIRDDLRDGAEEERFSPTPSTYARAVDDVRRSLACVPPPERDAAEELVDAVLSTP
jgi:geranylgeranyl pyrophosphate synthase